VEGIFAPEIYSLKRAASSGVAANKRGYPERRIAIPALSCIMRTIVSGEQSGPQYRR
jgi:hypothetical protein